MYIIYALHSSRTLQGNGVKPRETSELIGYSCGESTSRTTRYRLSPT